MSILVLAKSSEEFRQDLAMFEECHCESKPRQPQLALHWLIISDRNSAAGSGRHQP